MQEFDLLFLPAKETRDLFEDPLRGWGTVCLASAALTSNFHNTKIRIAMDNENCPFPSAASGNIDSGVSIRKVNIKTICMTSAAANMPPVIQRS